jgi:hypothetical protein
MVADLGRAELKGAETKDWRAQLRRFFESAFWERTIIILIVTNALAMGLETSPTVVAMTGDILRTIDNVVITIFTIEIALRIFAYGRSFWRDGWSLFDFTIVAIALMPATGGFAVLRSLRIIRALRLISTVKSMRRVMGGMEDRYKLLCDMMPAHAGGVHSPSVSDKAEIPIHTKLKPYSDC